MNINKLILEHVFCSSEQNIPNFTNDMNEATMVLLQMAARGYSYELSGKGTLVQVAFWNEYEQGTYSGLNPAEAICIAALKTLKVTF